MYAPSARATNTGVPPTARKARTGLFTPPGMTRLARSKSDREVGSDIASYGSAARRDPHGSVGPGTDPVVEASTGTSHMSERHVTARWNPHGERRAHREER